ncbi:hypothetical protein GCM10023332_17150 [Luteimonas vadosa]|uniref:Uncharacterized protein n=1 Tax=Luteimonas vadosa TaxID=1165507 RepID=A0ABP9E6C9_9GAMM
MMMGIPRSRTHRAAVVAILGFARRWWAAIRDLTEAGFPVGRLHQARIVEMTQNSRTHGLLPVVEGPWPLLSTLTLWFLGFGLSKRVHWMRPFAG